MITLKGITKTYKSGEVSFQALCGVDLTIEAGEFVAIMGPSGSGKSTLLHILGMLDRPDGGSYNFSGKEIGQLPDDQLALLRNHLAGFVFQQFHLLARNTALVNTELPLIYGGNRHLKSRAVDKLRAVGLAHRMNNKPNQMSGGEQQRVAIARALVNEPLVIFADEPTGNLDTKSEADIMGVLQKLNTEGKTIIMVTHEQEIADLAKRIIRMRDGKIVKDERRELPVKAAVSSNGQDTLSPVDKILHGKETLKTAEFMDHLRQAVTAILGSKVRSALSMLGILIGVAAVIAMMGLGQGAKDDITSRLSSLGSNLLTLRSGSHNFRGVASEAGGAETKFTVEDADAIKKLGTVKSISPSSGGSGQLVAGNKNWRTRIRGVGVAYPAMHNAVPASGRFFNEDEEKRRVKVAVLGSTVAKELFGEADPLGHSIRINRIPFEVIGVLPSKGAGPGGMDQDDTVQVPYTTAMYRLFGKTNVDSIEVEVKEAGLIAKAKEDLTTLIVQRHKLSGETLNSFQIIDLSEIQQTVAGTTNTISLLLGCIAAISLLVGGIGIMNIMLVSVTERIREIGLRKAIGARRKDILIQFLIEAVVLTIT
ncbi:MAG: ABC transporter permease, partial [Candidatus Margulisiibacteriota bacterium]